MARIITKELALKIADKLKAKFVEGKAHTLAKVYDDENVLVASFGIRHGSSKDQGHDHIKNSLKIGPHDARNLANCPLSRDGWLKIYRQKGGI